MGLAEVACIALHAAISKAAWEFVGGCMRWRTDSLREASALKRTGKADHLRFRDAQVGVRVHTGSQRGCGGVLQ